MQQLLTALGAIAILSAWRGLVGQRGGSCAGNVCQVHVGVSFWRKKQKTVKRVSLQQPQKGGLSTNAHLQRMHKMERCGCGIGSYVIPKWDSHPCDYSATFKGNLLASVNIHNHALCSIFCPQHSQDFFSCKNAPETNGSLKCDGKKRKEQQTLRHTNCLI